jgi:aspartyl-tRNA(Asn)/glutamyl-tRNA(Gln) amidotransferase subunit B
MSEYEPVIGLEIHVQLSTRTKMFCGCELSFGEPPNTRTCPVCLGLPGTLPRANARAIHFGLMIGLALGCDLAPRSIFHRKNYFYPDLPKGYQISQYDEPLCKGGRLGDVRIHRVHLEEDAAKLVHAGSSGRIHGSDVSVVDFNRGGTPLAEIVTEPDVRSAAQAREWLTLLRTTLRRLGVSDVNMEEGSLRCDANISIRPVGSTGLGTKTELKNMNSFRFIEKGIRAEVARQEGLLAAGGAVEQETLHFDPRTEAITSLRSKEQAHDYRYFPEPDLLPLELSPAYVRDIETQLPELPEHMLARFVEQYGLSEYDAGVLTSDRDLAAFYEAVAAEVDPKQASNWISGDLRALLNETATDISDSKVKPEHMKELIELVAAGTVSRSAARTSLGKVFETGDSPSVVIEREGLASVGSDELSDVVDEAISANPDEAERVRNGDKKVVGFLVGQVMKATRGNADGGRVRELLMEKLGS